MNHCQSSSPISDSLSSAFSPLGAQSYCARRDTQYSGNKQSISCNNKSISCGIESGNIWNSGDKLSNAPSSSYQSTSAFWNNSNSIKSM